METHPLYGELKITRKKSGYSRGKNGYEHILFATLNILIEEGYNSISFRNIAKACDMNVGNVNYYFSSKQELIRQLLEAIIGHYEDEFDKSLDQDGIAAEDRLRAYITIVLEDIKTKKTTRLFPELWVLANQDSFVADRVEALYRRARTYLNKIILDLNPDLPAKERETLALFLSASMEGMTTFAGYNKPWADHMELIINITTKSFLDLVKNITVNDISALSNSKKS
ncbi:TetR/AcrR family transcriptional regulator [Hellea balneolensis]|uniref:TetR/AcrR family transcriptional regulator n=1 Tax=Hellea balneolensis TaxID=287478 RepID=UPI0004027A71|nr:TetR/AcrR family transcriptional regulator [Hellea balneolensis]